MSSQPTNASTQLDSTLSYADALCLLDEFPNNGPALSKQQEQAITLALLKKLHSARHKIDRVGIPHSDSSAQRKLLDAALTISAPNTLSSTDTVALDRLLQSERQRRSITDANTLSKMPFYRIGNTKIVLWQGDITTLRCDAIVNAANSQLLGCFQPMHTCVDNAIHIRAGVQLRSDCLSIMTKQGHAEPTGSAKITRAYNLPSRYVIHTVGPIVEDKVKAYNKQALAASYQSVLNISAQIPTINSLTFCSISTGVFGYPIALAAKLAVKTVNDWLSNHTHQLDTVIFNVFSDHDYRVYQDVLEKTVCSLKNQSRNDC